MKDDDFRKTSGFCIEFSFTSFQAAVFIVALITDLVLLFNVSR